MAETILVVDDDPAVRELLGEGLAQRGYRVLTAPDGAEGLRLARMEQPTLVIADVLMPGLNGWELCRQVREDPTLTGIPFLFLSSVSDPSDRAHGLALGADDYVPKPVNLRELEIRIMRALRRGTPGIDAPLSGELSRLPPPDLLQLLTTHKQTGVLRLLTPAGQAQVTIREGKILAATFGDVRGREALFQLIAQEAGRFRFEAVQVYSQDEIQMDVQEIILEAIHHRDESDLRPPAPASEDEHSPDPPSPSSPR
ncbi:MAG: response regulator [Candidatus Methylomirabilales bacterium]